MVSSAKAYAASEAVVDSLRAKLINRSFGLKLGKFGLSYDSQDIVIEPEAKPAQTSKLANSNSFSNELEIAALHSELYADDSSNIYADSSDDTRKQAASPGFVKRCVNAYRQMSGSCQSMPQSVLLAVV